MRKLALWSVLFLSLGVGSAWASEFGTSDLALFNDTVNWCQVGGCAGATSSSATWTSAGGVTGTVALEGGQDFLNYQQVGASSSNTWYGNFPANMGLIYNYGQSDIVITFDQPVPVYGVGAYIQANYYGGFRGTIDLYDASNDLLVAYQAIGVTAPVGSSGVNALFIGGGGLMMVSSVDFHVQDASGNNDFAIGTMELSTTPMTTPEPCSMLLMGSFLGVLGFIRRKLF
jgi:hypothetical protein